MPLPDVTGFERFSDGFRQLGERLRSLGVVHENAEPILRICDGLFEPMCLPIRRYHMQKRSDVLAAAFRLFLFMDTLSRDEALAVLGDVSLEHCLDAGLLRVEEHGRVACPFFLNIVDSAFVLGDDLTLAGDAVMGAGATTADLCRAASSADGVERVLDLGCGAGTLGLFLASESRRVVATDINPRALVLARANALLSGIENIEFRQGDLFEPVRGEVFDLIVAQPPFIPRPQNADAITYLYGGARGDELPIRLLRELGAHLAPGGRAVILVQWPRIGKEELEGRIRDALGDPSLSLLLLCAPEVNPDEWSAANAASEERSLDGRFARRAVELRSHLDRMQIEGLRMAFSVVVKPSSPQGWTRRFDILPLSRAELRSRQIGALIATADISDAPDDRLLEARVGLPQGAELMEREGRFRVRFANVFAPVELSGGAALLVNATRETPCVRDAVASVAARFQRTPDIQSKTLEGLRQALRMGVLQVCEEPES